MSVEEAIKLEINVRLEEFKALRAEIVSTLTASYQTLNLSLTAAGLLIGASASLPNFGKPYWLGVASLVFYALLWTQLRYGYAVFNMSNHIIDKVAPPIRVRMREIQMPDTVALAPVLCWESAGRETTHAPAFWLVVIETARFVVPPLAAGFTFLGYVAVVASSPAYKFDGRVDVALALLNAVLFGFSAWACFRLRSLLRENSDGHERPAHPVNGRGHR
jgi:hypothetical protein